MRKPQHSKAPQFRAMGDSGLISAYRPARHQKPRGIIKRAIGFVAQMFVRPRPEETTEQGSGSASPITYEASLLAQRVERINYVQDCREMVANDIRARRSTLKYAAEVVRGGVSISINPKATPEKLGARADERLQSLARILTPQKMLSWVWMMIVEGDLFVQGIESQRSIVGAKRMPAAAMERLTDDSDEFINPEKAFEQIDVNSWESVAQFPLALMYHQRWNHIDGERYGTPEIIAARRMRRILDLVEEAKMVDRVTRAPQRKFWHVGNKEKAGLPADVEEFKAKNGFVEGSREIFDPMNVALDYFDNGLGSCEVLDGSANVDAIEDLKYYQRVYGAGLPTPLTLIGLDLDEVNRDVMEDLRAEWLKETQRGQDALVEVIRWLCDLQLMLSGILPESVVYDVKLSDSSIETPAEVTDRVIKQVNARLLPKRNAMQTLAEFNNIDDIEAALAELEDEDMFIHDRKIEQLKARSPLVAPTNGNGNGNGKSKDLKVSDLTGK